MKDQDVYKRQVDKFNKETKSGYTVNQVAIQNDTYKEKLVIAMSSGECLSLIHISLPCNALTSPFGSTDIALRILF